MKDLRRVVIIAAVVTLIGEAAAGSLHKIWDFNAGNGMAVSGVPLGVFALSFSPDGQRVVAVAGHSVHEEFILVLYASAPQTNPKRLDVNPQTLEETPSWSSAGQHFVLGRAIVDSSNGTTCSLPEGREFFFVGPAQVAGQQSEPTRLSFFDSDCHASGTSEFGKYWDVYDASAERRLLCIWQHSYTGVYSRWHPKSQALYLGEPKAVSVGKQTKPSLQIGPYRVAISPDGEYVAEGGAGTLSLYKIEP